MVKDLNPKRFSSARLHMKIVTPRYPRNVRKLGRTKLFLQPQRSTSKERFASSEKILQKLTAGAPKADHKNKTYVRQKLG